MKNAWNKSKWILLLLINVLPFALNVIFYKTGILDDLFWFAPVFAGLTVLNYLTAKKTLPYLLYQVAVLACIIGGGYLSTYLYYHNISNDSMTPVVGALGVFVEASISVIATTITAVIKAVRNKHRPQSGNGR